jgi:hypothetical protein
MPSLRSQSAKSDCCDGVTQEIKVQVAHIASCDVWWKEATACNLSTVDPFVLQQLLCGRPPAGCVKRLESFEQAVDGFYVRVGC